MSRSPNVTYRCESCGGVTVEGLPHRCSGTAAPQPACWQCPDCLDWIYRGVEHICAPTERPQCEAPPPPPRGRTRWEPGGTIPIQSASPDWAEITRLLGRIAVAVERISDRMK